MFREQMVNVVLGGDEFIQGKSTELEEKEFRDEVGVIVRFKGDIAEEFEVRLKREDENWESYLS